MAHYEIIDIDGKTTTMSSNIKDILNNFKRFI